jgi:glycosyltransferase involved in cell wall biosynthesis
MSSLIFAVCTFNRAERLSILLGEMRKQICSESYEILVIDNNSTDNTKDVVLQEKNKPGPSIRYVFEREQGITYARNRAIKESLDSTYMVFIDDDESPGDGYLNTAVDALKNKGAECVGGRVQITFDDVMRPSWLVDDLLGFLGEADHGDDEFWVRDESVTLYTGNIAYRTEIFNNKELRFDDRYNRKGKGLGGGEDVRMFKEMLKNDIKILYQPGMLIWHHVEPWRLKRKYFLVLHYLAGKRKAMYEFSEYNKTIFGVPPFMFTQAFMHMLKTLKLLITGNKNSLRQAMNFTHSLGVISGSFIRTRH